MEFEEVVPPFWHAFSSLDGHQTGNGLKSQLKVLAFNIAMSLGVELDKDVLEEYKDKDNVCFEDFLSFVKVEILDKANKSSDQNANSFSVDVDKINETCWLVCQKRYVERREGKRLLSRDDVQKLWRVFNFLSEIDEQDRHITPIYVHRDEGALIMSKIQSSVGRVYDRDVFEEACKEIKNFSYEQFLHLIEHTCCQGLGAEAASVAIQDIYSEYILEVMKKGWLHKKAPASYFHSWSERWFVLTPRCLQYYADKDEKDLKGTVDINQHCRAGPNTSSDRHRPHRFQLATKENSRTYELSASDARTKTEWLTLLNAAIESSATPYGPQTIAWLQRRRERKAAHDRELREQAEAHRKSELVAKQKQELDEAKREKDELKRIMDEELKKKDSIIARLQEIEKERATLQQQLSEEASKRDSHLKQLQALEKERENLREKLETESVLHEAEKARTEELKRVQEELERRLEEEKQAKSDEEIARNLAAIALREELEKREELERLKEEQERQLEEEQKKRKDLEEFKKAQQELLEQERQKLEHLSLDREKKDQELQEALEKISKAELAKQEIEKKVKDTQSPAFRKLLADRIMQEIVEGTPEIISHRGKGAFTVGEFEQIGQMRRGLMSRETSYTESESFPLPVESNGTKEED